MECSIFTFHFLYMKNKITTDGWIEKVRIVHNDIYDYSLVEYLNNTTKVKIICPIHGVFEQIPKTHLKGCDCPKCGIIKRNNSLRLTKEEFINKSNAVHNHKYDYSLTEYINSNTKVKIICPIHGEFKQNTNSHMKGIGCAKCSNQYLDKNFFIEKSEKIHGNKYDYSLVEYINNATKVKIICSIHGVFEQIPNAHLNGNGCLKCANKNVTTEDFIEKARKIHGNKYGYSLVKYVNNSTKVKIICTKHGIFNQDPQNHLSGSGCLICGIDSRNDGLRKNTEYFVNKSKLKHGNTYDYSLAEYKHGKKKIDIICPKHGIFKQIANDHMQGVGCPMCKQSRGERKITQYLLKNNVNFIYQKGFDDCRDVNRLSFDFYLPDSNICIEFDGKQHYEINEYFGGIKSFVELQKRDEIKNEYCLNSNIKLIRIRYDDNIKEKLNSILF